MSDAIGKGTLIPSKISLNYGSIKILFAEQTTEPVCKKVFCYVENPFCQTNDRTSM